MDADETDHLEAESTGVVTTGVPAVDAVIARVASTSDQPLEEHPGVFTEAHEALRRALDEIDPTPDAGTGPAPSV